MEIELKELQLIINRLIDHIVKTRNIDRVVVKETAYWNIPPESLYKLDEKPSMLDVGDLRDDWEFVSSFLDESRQPVAYQLTEVAPLLRYIGETLGQDLAKHGG